MYSITAVASLTGIPVETLRNWEKRYAFLSPNRNKKGLRVYSAEDIELLKSVRYLLDQGAKIGDIAQSLSTTGRLPEAAVNMSAQPPGTSHFIECFYQALIGFDLGKLEFYASILRASMTLSQKMEFVYGYLFNRIAEERRAGLLRQAEAKFATVFLCQRLLSFLSPRDSVLDQHRPAVICSTLPGDSGVEDMLLMASCLKLAGSSVLVLGAEAPIDEAQNIALKLGANALYYSASSAEAIEVRSAELEQAMVPIFLGGAGAQACKWPLQSASVILVRSTANKGAAEVMKHLQVHAATENSGEEY